MIVTFPEKKKQNEALYINVGSDPGIKVWLCMNRKTYESVERIAIECGDDLAQHLKRIAINAIHQGHPKLQ
jgi:hypothetical protein